MQYGQAGVHIAEDNVGLGATLDWTPEILQKIR